MNEEELKADNEVLRKVLLSAALMVILERSLNRGLYAPPLDRLTADVSEFWEATFDWALQSGALADVQPETIERVCKQLEAMIPKAVQPHV